jgi:hypothetical protein
MESEEHNEEQRERRLHYFYIIHNVGSKLSYVVSGAEPAFIFTVNYEMKADSLCEQREEMWGCIFTYCRRSLHPD